MREYKSGVVLVGDSTGAVKAVKLTRKELDNLNGTSKKTGRSFKDLSKKTNDLSGSMRKLKQFAVAGTLALGAREYIKQADAAQSLTQKIKTATGASGDYLAVQAKIIRLSNEAGIGLETTAELFQRIAISRDSLRATNDEILLFTGAVQKLGVIGGSSQDELNNGLRQLSQGLSGGVLRAEELNSLLENTPRIAQEIEKGMGLLPGTLRAAVLEGEVLSQDVFKAILGQIPQINKEFAEFEQRVGSSTTRLENAFTILIGKIDSEVGLTGALKAAADGLADLLNQATGVGDIERLEGKIAVLQDTLSGEKANSNSKNSIAARLKVLKQELLEAKAASGDADALVRRWQQVNDAINAEDNKSLVSQVAGNFAFKNVKSDYAELIELRLDLEAKLAQITENGQIERANLRKKAADVELSEEKKLFADITELQLKAGDKLIKQNAKARKSDADLVGSLEDQISVLQKVGIERAIQENLLKLSTLATEEQRKEVERLTRSLENLKNEDEKVNAFAESWAEAGKRIDETFADAFTGAFDNFTEFGDSLLDGFKRLLGELAYEAVKNKITVEFGSALGGLNGNGGTDAAALTSSAASAAAIKSVANIAALAAVADTGYDGYKQGVNDVGKGKQNTFTAISYANALFPGLSGKLFGKKKRITDYGIELGIDAGDIDGNSYRRTKREGFGGSTSRRTRRYDIDSGLESNIQETLESAQAAIIDGFSDFGVNLGADIFDTFSTEFVKISLAGKTDEQIAAAIDEFIGGTADKMVESIGAGFDSFEELVEGAQRLVSIKALFSTNKENIDSVADNLSRSFDRLGVAMPGTRGQMRQLIEGLDLLSESGRDTLENIERLAPALTSYYETEQERAAKFFGAIIDANQKRVADWIEAAGVAKKLFQDTKAFQDNISEQLATAGLSDFGREMYNLKRSFFVTIADAKALNLTMADLGNASELLEVQTRKLLIAQEGTISRLAGELYEDGFSNLITAERERLAEIQEAEQKLHTEQTTRYKLAIDAEKTLTGFIDGLQTDSSLSIYTTSQRASNAKGQFDALEARALGGDATAVGQLTSAASEYLTLQRELFASSSEYTASFKDVNQRLAKVSALFAGSVEPEALKKTETTARLDSLETLQAAPERAELAGQLIEAIRDYNSANGTNDFAATADQFGVNLESLFLDRLTGLGGVYNQSPIALNYQNSPLDVVGGNTSAPVVIDQEASIAAITALEDRIRSLEATLIENSEADAYQRERLISAVETGNVDLVDTLERKPAVA